MTLGTNIVNLREARHMSQYDLADKLGISRGAVSQWETGISNPRMSSVEKLAAIFGVKKSDLIDGEIGPDGIPLNHDNNDDAQRMAREAEAHELFSKLDATQQAAILQLMRVM